MSRAGGGRGRLIYLSWLDARYNGGDRAETWNGARSFCRRNCMDLAAMDGAAVNRHLVDKVREGRGVGGWGGRGQCCQMVTKGTELALLNFLSKNFSFFEQTSYSPFEQKFGFFFAPIILATLQ